MRKYIGIIIIGIVAVLLLVIPAMRKIKLTTADSYALLPDEFQELSNNATSGDGKAAFRIAQYYYFSARDLDWSNRCAETRRWLSLGVTNGNQQAKSLLKTFEETGRLGVTNHLD